MRHLLLLTMVSLGLIGVGWGRDITTVSGNVFHEVVVTGVRSNGLEIRFQAGTAFLTLDEIPSDQLAAFWQTGGENVPPPEASQVPPPEPLDEEPGEGIVVSGPAYETYPEIDALDGSVYQDVVITSIGPSFFRFRHRNGVGCLNFNAVPEQWRHRLADLRTAYAHNSANWSRPASNERAYTGSVDQSGDRSTMASPTRGTTNPAGLRTFSPQRGAATIAPQVAVPQTRVPQAGGRANVVPQVTAQIGNAGGSIGGFNNNAGRNSGPMGAGGGGFHGGGGRGFSGGGGMGMHGAGHR